MSRGATRLWLSLALLVATAAVYAPVRHYEFTDFDDNLLISENPHVSAGLTRENIVRAWLQPEAGTWQRPLAFYSPLTALSDMLVCEFFGLNPGAHHLANVVIHVLSTLLLFSILTRTTGQPWRSAFVAGLFALHPLQVEPVAWIAARKTVLSSFFWLVTISTYISYVRRPGARRYALLLAAYAAALLSEPTAVTLPFALLLLDVWPLGRLTLDRHVPPSPPVGTVPMAPVHRPALTRLLAEKLPMLPLAGAFCIIAIVLQWRTQSSTPNLLADRVANALASYATYLGNVFWPAQLGNPYAFAPIPPAQVVAAVTLLVGISVLVLWGTRRHPYLLVGWLWYLGTLLPTIGLVGALLLSPRSDRYMYIPSIGIFVILAWGVPDLLARRRHRQAACAAAGVTALAACTVLTSRQLPHWRTRLSLFQHTLAVTHDNLVAEAVVGKILQLQGRPDEAWDHFLEVLRIAEVRGIGRVVPYWHRVGPIEPYYSDSEANVGLILLRRGDPEAAQQHYLKALSINPANAKAHQRLGLILAGRGDTNDAVAHYREALRLEPDLAAAHNNLAITLEDIGQMDEAIAHYAEGVRLEPQNVESRCNYAAALAKAGHLAEAIEQFRTAVELKPQLAAAHFGLASAYAQAGQTGAAITEFDTLRQQQPDSPALEVALAWLLATADDAHLRDGGRALQLAEDADRRTGHDDPDALNALAAAYAETGRFTDAVETAERALAAAGRKGQTALLNVLPARLAQYNAGQAVHDHR